MFQIGIIGCGKIAQVRHIPEYTECEDMKLAGFYDINKERAEELADRYGAKAYASYEALLQDETIDAVSVCAANHVHAEITVAALRAGKHVLCEKPMAMSLEECEEMVRVSAETGKFLMIGHNQRLTKAHKEAKKLIGDGAIGKIITFRTSFAHKGPETWSVDPGKDVWFFDKDKAVMGAMADLGIHKTDLIQFLIGSRVVETTAFLGTLDKKYATGEKIGVDDNAICIYKMENGVVGTMTASWTCYGEEENATVLYGTEGVMRIYENPDYAIVVERKNGEKVCYAIDRIQTNDNQLSSGVIAMFAEALRSGREPEINGEEALSAMKAVFASVQSAESGKTVKV